MKRLIPAVLLLVTLISPLYQNAGAETDKGSYIDQIQFIHYLDESVAVQEVKAGNLDLYLFRMPLELVQSTKEDHRVRVYESVGGSLSILLNPAPADEGLNPFSIKEVRYAMNYLIDRQLIVNEILKGFGAPMPSAFSIFDPDYLVLLDAIESVGFSYNPRLADKMISDALTSHGAVKKNDRWFFNEKPIVVKFMIRSDDPRRNAIGELLTSELERIGFTVSKDVGDLNKAFTVVYGSDPKLQGWHIYTEGWAGRSAFVRYDTSQTAQMYAPWFAQMPGFQIPGFWNYENPELDEVTQRIFTGNFTTKEERDQLLGEAVKLGISESVRIFIASLVDPYITASDLDGVVNDFSAGVTSRFTLIEGRTPDERDLKVGVKQIYQGAWNPIGGFRDVYASRIWGVLIDPGTFRNPYTGDVIPVRTEFEVQTAGPEGKLAVPADAIIWEPVNEKWAAVGDGVTATSKTTYDLTYSNWHHGVTMDVNDILHAIYFTHEWGTTEGDDDRTVDPEYTSTTEPLVATLKGYRFLSDDRVEVYFDYWHFDEGEIADYGAVWSSMPWEIMAAMERIVLNGEAAFSKSAADAKNVDWLSLIISSNAQMVRKTLEDFKRERFVPADLKDSVSEEEALARYEAAIRWIDEKKHAVISNGPFYLQNYNPEARSITVRAFRDDSYPYEVGRWKEFEEAKVATIYNADVPLTVVRGSEAVISGTVRIDGDPSRDVNLYYFVKDSGGKVVLRGGVIPARDGGFQIPLSKDDTERLSVGSHELKMLAVSNLALRPDIYGTSLVGLSDELVPVTTPDTDGQGPLPQPPSGCLIATAAFGSELSPQVRFLRSFRDDMILSTAAGSSFMNVFNAWYYSFSPQVADYERSNSWMQQAVRGSIYPLIGILLVSEKIHISFGGEVGAVAAGLGASFLIGALYFLPLSLAVRIIRRSEISLRIPLLAVVTATILVVMGMLSSSAALLMASTSMLVLSTLIAGALISARLFYRYAMFRIRTG